jgi:hypothetical protein
MQCRFVRVERIEQRINNLPASLKSYTKQYPAGPVHSLACPPSSLLTHIHINFHVRASMASGSRAQVSRENAHH